MEYRSLRPEEVVLLRRAEEYCFHVAPSEYDAFVMHKMRPEECRGIFGPDGDLLAGMINFPLQVYMGGARLKMGGIAGVVSWPESRRAGYVAELLVRSIAEMKEAEWPLSSLYPFKQPFYRRYGWEVTAAWVQHEFAPDLLTQYRGNQGTVRRYAPGEANWLELARLYNEAFSHRFGYIARETEAFWSDWVNPLWSPWGNIYHTAVWSPAPGAAAEGYLLYRFVKEDDSRIFMVKELAALTPAAEQGLWGFVAQHDSQVKAVRHRTPREYPLWHLVENTTGTKSTLGSGWMLRLVDLKPAFEQRPWPGAPDGALTFAVTDAQAPWNQGTWRLSFESGHATLSPAPTATPDLTTHITTLAQLYAGFVKPGEAVRTGRLTCADPRALKLLAQATTDTEMWFYEFF